MNPFEKYRQKPTTEGASKPPVLCKRCKEPSMTCDTDGRHMCKHMTITNYGKHYCGPCWLRFRTRGY
jgi:hypothetical protein